MGEYDVYSPVCSMYSVVEFSIHHSYLMSLSVASLFGGSHFVKSLGEAAFILKIPG